MRVEQFEISLIYDNKITFDDLMKSSILESDFFCGSNCDIQLFESGSIIELFISGNQKIFFDRKNIYQQINSLGTVINEICRRKSFLYGIANYETNSLFMSEPYPRDVSKNAISKSAFIFLNNQIDENNYLNKYHIIFEYSQCKLLFNPKGQVLWSVTDREIRNSCLDESL